MPFDLLVANRFKKSSYKPAELRGAGNADFTWNTYENDIQFNGLKRSITISGVDKLKQGIFKIIVTPKESIPEDPEYGTSLQTEVGTKLNNERFTNIQTDIIDALIHYNQININNQNSDEVIQTIEEVNVFQDLDDPRAIKIKVSVTTESGIFVRVETPEIKD